MKYIKRTLDNGLSVVIVPLPNNPTVTVYAGANTGSEYEEENINGLSHFLEHMCFKATPKRPTAKMISEELDAIGAINNAFTSQEHTVYFAKSDKKHFDKILDVVSDIYQNPTFPESELEKERGVILQEYKMYLDDLKWHVSDLWQELLYGNTPAGRRIIGSPKTIESLKRDDFVKYHSDRYGAENTTVLVSGGIEEDEAFEKVKKAFSGIKAGNKKIKELVREKQNGPEIKVFYKDSDQTHIVIGVRTFDMDDKRMKTMRVLRSVLSGGMSARLFQKMREELGICYYVYANQDSFTDHGNFSVSAGVDQNRLEIAISAILAELKKLKTEKVSLDELAKTKDGMIGRIRLHLESSDDIGGFYLERAVLKKDMITPDDLEKEIMDVTADDIMSLAKEIFDDKTLNLAIVGKHKNETDIKKLLSFDL